MRQVEEVVWGCRPGEVGSGDGRHGLMIAHVFVDVQVVGVDSSSLRSSE